jgi:hypothetical protein
LDCCSKAEKSACSEAGACSGDACSMK